MMYHITRILWALLAAPILSIEVSGREHIPREGAFILVSKHIGICDAWIVTHAVGLGSRPIRWLAGINLFTVDAAAKKFAPGKIRPVAWCVGFAISFVVKHSLTIPVEREEDGGKRFSTVNKHALVEMKEVLGSPHGVIGIFPEGGYDRKRDMHTSFVNLAQKRGVPILPVCLEKGKVTFGELIVPHKDLLGKARAEEARVIMEKIYELKAA